MEERDILFILNESVKIFDVIYKILNSTDDYIYFEFCENEKTSYISNIYYDKKYKEFKLMENIQWSIILPKLNKTIININRKRKFSILKNK